MENTQINSESNLIQIPLGEIIDSSNNLRNGKWTQEEDEVLKNLVLLHGSKNWKAISEQMSSRTPVQCLHRWTKILQPGLVKGPWTIEEDRKLLEWVKKEGACKWSHCADFIEGRSGKQCRERWFNTLNPNVKKGNWTAYEDYLIFNLYSEYGSKWSRIAAHFKGRTENSIKNRFYSTLRRLHADKKKCEGGILSTSQSNQTSLDELIKFFPEALKEKKEKYLESKDEFNEEEELDIPQEGVENSLNNKEDDLSSWENGSNNKKPLLLLNKKTKREEEVIPIIPKKINNTFNFNVNISNTQKVEEVIDKFNNNNEFKLVDYDLNKYQKFNTPPSLTTQPMQIVNQQMPGNRNMLHLFSQLTELSALLNNTKSEIRKFDTMKNTMLINNTYLGSTYSSPSQLQGNKGDKLYNTFKL
jgi:hypothetical protein